MTNDVKEKSSENLSTKDQDKKPKMAEKFQEFRDKLGYGEKADREQLAHLRRISVRADNNQRLDISPILSHPLSMNFLRAYAKGNALRAEKFAAIFAVLAEVKEHDRSMTLMKALGQSKPGSTNPRLSLNRFRRVLTINDTITLRHEGQRLVRFANTPINVGQLGADLYYLTHPEWGDKTRLQWSFDYMQEQNTLTNPNTN